MSEDRYLHWTTETVRKRRYTSMPVVEFEPTIAVLEMEKLFRNVDRKVAVIMDVKEGKK